MIRIYCTLLTLAVVARDTASTRLERSRDDRGVITLETVMIALGLFIVAGIVIAAITAAVNSRVAKIK